MSFSKGITLKEFIRFFIPSIVVMISISVYAIVDAYFVSTYVGSDALAAMNLIIPINSIIFAVGLMFATGGGALASIKLGEKNTRTASSYFSILLEVAIIFGLIVTALAFIFHEELLAFLGVNESLYDYAKTYSYYIIATLPFIITKMMFAGFLRAEGNPKTSLIMSTIGGLVNMVLDVLFIIVLDMGIAGAGLGTMLGIIAALIYGGAYYASEKATFKFRLCPINITVLKDTIFNGSSEMVNELAIGYTSLVFNLLMLKYAGNDGVAAISVILYLNLFVSCFYIGFAFGTAPLLSYHYGAKDSETLNKIRKYARYTLGVLSPAIVLLFVLCNSALVSFFLGDASNASGFATHGLFIFASSFLFTGYNMYGSAMYTALSNGKISALIAFSKTFVFFTAGALILPAWWGMEGIWYIMPLTELLTAAMVFYLTREKQLQRFVNLNFAKPESTFSLPKDDTSPVPQN